jgi:hypothetical protein
MARSHAAAVKDAIIYRLMAMIPHATTCVVMTAKGLVNLTDGLQWVRCLSLEPFPRYQQDSRFALAGQTILCVWLL